MAKRPGFTQSRFILAEGEEDAQFARALIAGRNLRVAFDVSPNIDLGHVGGVDGFESAIIASEPLTGFTAVTDVVILADNDDNPTASFDRVRNQIETARNSGGIARNWGAATTPATKAAGNPSVSIWMWPAAGQPGCFETLLWQVISTLHKKEAACVEDACKCAGIVGWPLSKLDKARVRCFVAMMYRRNPALALSLLWRDQPGLIPVANRAFKPFSDFLAQI